MITKFSSSKLSYNQRYHQMMAGSVPLGVTWSSMTLPASAQWADVVYGDKFVTTDNFGNVYTSNDGTTWTSRGAIAAGNGGNNWRSLAVNSTNTMYVGVSFYQGWKASSPDGVTWTDRGTTGATGKSFYRVRYVNGYFVAFGSTTYGGSGNNDSYIYSANGTTWTTVSASQNFVDVFYAGGNYCFLDGFRNVFTMASIGATPSTPTSTVFSQYVQAVITPAGAPTGVAIGKVNFFYGNTSSTAWTAITPPSNDAWWNVTWNGQLFFAIAGSNNANTAGTTAVAYSADGQTWTLKTLPTTQYWSGIAASSGRAVAVAGSNGLTQSPTTTGAIS